MTDNGTAASSVPAHVRLIQKAGFHLQRVIPTTSVVSIVEALPA